MSFDKFKKFKNPYINSSLENEDNKYEKQYNKQKSSSENEFEAEKGILDGPYRHLVTKYTEIDREIKFIKEDLSTLYLMIMNENLPETMTLQEIREQYFKFRLDKRHLSNKKPLVKIINE